MRDKLRVRRTIFEDPEAEWDRVKRSGNPYLKRALIIFAVSFVAVQVVFAVKTLVGPDLYRRKALE